MGIVKPLYVEDKYKDFTNFPQPYTIEAPRNQSTFIRKDGILKFTLNLLEPAIEYLLIWLQALDDIGYLYADRKSAGKLILEKVSNIPSGTVIYADEMFFNAPVEKRELIKVLPDKCYLKMVTPLRLKSDGKPLEGVIGPDVLSKRMIERVNQLNRCYGNGKMMPDDDSPFLLITGQELYWSDIPHRSNHQNSKLKMGGLKGTIEINIIKKQFSPLIHFSTIFGLGSYVTAGYGKMELAF